MVEQVVKLSTHITKFKGSNAAAATVTRGRIIVKCVLVEARCGRASGRIIDSYS